MRKLLLFAFVYAYAAHAEVTSGTIVIVGVSDNKLIVASDSKETTFDGSRLPCYAECKIATFDRQIVFTSTNVRGYKPIGASDSAPAWTTTGEASVVIMDDAKLSAVSARDKLHRIASAWAEAVKSRLIYLLTVHPDALRGVPISDDGKIILGFFASAGNGTINIEQISLTFRNGIFGVQAWNFPDDCRRYCGFGEAGLFSEFVNLASPRAKHEFANITTSPSLQSIDPFTIGAIRLADLIAAYDTHGDTGGSIDAIEMWDDGSLHWIARKHNCQ